MSRGTVSGTGTVTTTTSKLLYLFIKNTSHGPTLCVSKTDIPGSAPINASGFYTMNLMFALVRENAFLSRTSQDVIEHILSFLYCDIAAVLVEPRNTELTMHDRFPRLMMIKNPCAIKIPRDYYLRQTPIKEAPGKLTQSYDPEEWDNFGRRLFDVSVTHRINSSLHPLLTACLNAVEHLGVIRNIIDETSQKQRAILLFTPSTANIEHLNHLNIQRTGTPLQLALYGGDEDIVAYLKTVMDPEEFERQSKEAFRNALPPAKQTELDALNASALEYYNAMLIAQKAAAEKLCNEAFAFDADNNRFTITNDTIADFQQKLTDNVKNNTMHNPFILHRLYEIYEKLPYECAKDGLFSEKVLGHAHALSSARWLQHYAQGILYLGDGGMPEPVLRSFICRDPNPPVDVRSFIPSRLGVDSFVSILGWRCSGLGGGDVVGSAGMWPTSEEPSFLKSFVRKKQEAFRTCYATSAPSMHPATS